MEATLVRRRSRCRSIACVLPALLVGVFGCQSQTGGGKGDLAPGLANTRTQMQVLGTDTLGPYFVAHLQMAGDRKLDAYAMPSPACTEVFTVGESVTYVDNGPQGVYHRGDARCQQMGVGNLLIWRNRSVHSAAGILPRTQVAFHVLFKGEEYALLRGQFPGAAAIGFTGDYDIVAVIPVAGNCQAILEQRTASMEYRDKGSRVFSLIGPRGLCDIHAFVQPPPQIAEGDDDAPGHVTGSGIE